jgi:hypothetical protein
MIRYLFVCAALGFVACWGLPAFAADDTPAELIPGNPDGKTPGERAPVLLPDADSREKIGIFSFVLENDLFYDTDRRYTNGVRLTYLTPKGGEPAWLHDAFLSLPMFNPATDIRVEYGLGQSMYTASDKLQANPPLDDRPYAGWLYGSVGVVANTEQGDGRRVLDQLQFSLGVVGPASLAHQTQDFIHGIVNSPRAQGWDTQLKNEPALQAIYQRSWQSAPLTLPAGFAVDATPHAGVALGNVFDFVNTGAMLRFGQNLPVDYGSPRVQPSLPGSGYFEPVDDFGWYLFGGFDGRAVARNIFLDGNTFATSRSVDKRNFVGDAEFGLAIIVHDVRFSYTHVFRTKEYKTQDVADQFGVFSVSFRF